MISIERQPWREMVNHAQATYPNECCGAMIGKIDGDSKTVVHALALENTSPGSQAARYELRPEDLLRADREARERKMDLIGQAVTKSASETEAIIRFAATTL